MRSEWLAGLIFITVIIFILWRPRKILEAVPAILGAAAMFALGYISLAGLRSIFHLVSGPGFTILSTIIMSSVLDRAGFFQWAANQLVIKANGSGKKLFIYVLLLCFLMTLFFNNDGSVLITTPIIVRITKNLHLSKINALPYLLGGALIASSSSAPIGVSNLANLIALRIVGLNLNEYARLMILPSMMGIIVCGWLLYLVFRRTIPVSYSLHHLNGHLPGQTSKVQPIHMTPPHPRVHPNGKPLHLRHPDAPPHPPAPPPPPTHPKGKPEKLPHLSKRSVLDAGIDPLLFKVGITIVILTRIGLFIAQAFNIPISIVAVTGAALLLIFYAGREPSGPWRILKGAPWHIIVFAFGMYVIVYSLHNLGLTVALGHVLKEWSSNNLFKSVLFTGGFLTVMSCLMNNLPSVMFGTIMLTDMHLPTMFLHLSYLANILGSDIGSLILPLGTLASLMWFHIVSKHYEVTWGDYMKVSFRVIPISLIVSLVALFSWGALIL